MRCQRVVPRTRAPECLTAIPLARRWAPDGVPDGFQLFIKRDDLTGSTLSGNKVRKLEFLLADAKVFARSDGGTGRLHG